MRLAALALSLLVSTAYAQDGTRTSLQFDQTDFTRAGSSISLADGGVDVAELASADFGSWTCNGSACTIDSAAVAVAMLASADFGSWTCNGSACTIDNSAVTVGMLASADFGSWTCNGSACTIDATAVTEAMLASEDYGSFTCGDSADDCTLDAGSVSGGTGGVITDASITNADISFDHGTIGGLTDDDHAGYARLEGRATTQTLIGDSDGAAGGAGLILRGSTGNADDLRFETTSGATKGSYIFADLTSCDTIDTNGSGALACGSDDDAPDAGDFGALALTGVVTSSGLTTSWNNVQISSIAGLTSAADKFPYYTGSGSAALADLSSNMRTFMMTSSSANLLAVVTDETGTGAGTPKLVFSESPTLTTPTFSGTAVGSISGNAATVTTNANLTGPITSVGNATTVTQAELAALASLTSAADKVPYFTGSGTAALADLTSAGRALLDDANIAAQLTTLGNGTAATGTANSAVVLATSPTIASATLTTPTIAATGWTNATHAHTAANSGGTLTPSAVVSGTVSRCARFNGSGVLVASASGDCDAGDTPGTSGQYTTVSASAVNWDGLGVKVADANYSNAHTLDFGGDFSVAAVGVCVNQANEGTACSSNTDCGGGTGICATTGEKNITLSGVVYKQGTKIQASDLADQTLRTDVDRTLGAGTDLDFTAGTLKIPLGTSAANADSGKIYFDTNGGTSTVPMVTVGAGSSVTYPMRTCWTERVGVASTTNIQTTPIYLNVGFHGQTTGGGAEWLVTPPAVPVTISGLSCQVNEDLGASEDVAFTLQRGTSGTASNNAAKSHTWADQTVACTITGSASADEYKCTDATHTFTVSTSQVYRMKISATANPTWAGGFGIYTLCSWMACADAGW